MKGKTRMKTYKITFEGREKDCIGAFYSFTDIITAHDENAAQIKLYEKYDHIHFPKIEEVES